MKQLKKNLAMYLCMFLAVFCAMTLKAEAGNVRTGTVGDNDGITWTYDEDTKTLTITGEDSGLQGDYNRTENTYKSQFATICADVEVIKIQNCTLKGDATGVFAALSSLKTIECNNFDTSNVTSMKYMFYNCKNLSSLDVSHFDTSKVTDMCYMFYNCKNLSVLNVSSFDTSKVENMSFMFQGCRRLSSLDVSNFDTSNVGYMIRMFYDCSSLSSVDLSAFDLTTIVCADGMYYVIEMLSNCSNLTYIKTPKKMSAGMTTALPDTFLDAKGTEYKSITNTICGKTLYSRQMYNKVVNFVERMYTVALDRAAEADGLDFYTERLLSGDANGACLAQSFLCSPEFLNKGYDNAQYVKVLYKTFFDREPATEEVDYWVGQLNGGKTRAFVLAGFVNSVEFDNLCASYGISRGFMREDGNPINPGIGRFAERLYTVVLERAGEKDGIEFWSLSIANGVCTPKDAAKNFFLSPEYINKNTSDAKYITTLYKAFMDREPEAGGVEYWQGVLNNGATREQILEGFADSAEFKGIMASFGL